MKKLSESDYNGGNKLGVIFMEKNTKGADERSIIKIDEALLRNKIYTIRGQKVMLDSDLAEIYGYETKAFNRQVKNNIEKFDEDFMFRLTGEEFLRCQNGTSKVGFDLRCKNYTSNIELGLRSKKLTSKQNGRGGNRYLPYVFTEQGVYMLMTVLRGKLATQQSKALIRTFQAMKDYIMENRELTESREQLKIAATALENTEHIAKIENELSEMDRRMEKIENKTADMLAKSDISPILLDFRNVAEQKDFVFLDGELMRASELYVDIYSRAKQSIFIIDNYASIKTLRHLQNARPGVEIIIFSDNSGKYLCKNDYADFRRERNDLGINFIKTAGKIHDRFIILDYGTRNELIYHCGASEKDAGRKLMMISKYTSELMTQAMSGVIESLMKNPRLMLG